MENFGVFFSVTDNALFDVKFKKNSYVLPFLHILFVNFFVLINVFFFVLERKLWLIFDGIYIC